MDPHDLAFLFSPSSAPVTCVFLGAKCDSFKKVVEKAVLNLQSFIYTTYLQKNWKKKQGKTALCACLEDEFEKGEGDPSRLTPGLGFTVM